MIIPQLIGRLGNQAFQIACAVGYARKHGLEYCVPEMTVAPNAWPNYFDHLSNKCDFSKLNNPQVLKETEHSYQELPEPGKHDVFLEGYWQTEKYFKDNREEILKLFNPDWKSRGGTVSVHVRRGDFLLYPTKHPVITDEYLDRAYIELEKQTEQRWKYIFFSDDIPYVKQFVSTRFTNDNEYDIVEGKTPMEDLKAMSECTHHIISNSSFSWWGAWLNRNPNKIVIAPSVWFGPDNDHLNTKDLIPEDWIKL